MIGRQSILGACLALGAMSLAHGSEPAASSAGVEGGINTRTMLKQAGAHLHKHFLVDPRVVGTIYASSDSPGDISYSELLSLMRLNGYTIVPAGNSLLVLPDIDVRQFPTPLVAPDNIKELDDEFVTCVIPLKTLAAPMLVPVLRPLVPPNGHLAAVNDRNGLIVVDRAGNVRRLVEIIKQLEKLPKSELSNLSTTK